MSDKIVPLHRLPPGAPYWEVGGLVDRTEVTLALHGDDLDPPEITRRIGREPTHAHRRGEPSEGPKVKIPYKSGAWLLTVDVEAPEGPEEATEELLDLLPDDQGLWQELSERYDMYFSYGIFFDGVNRGFTLSADLQRRLATYHADLSFDLYSNQS
ncbi:MAG: DUF4279 domain-containing protein [Alphaproteobacteria bacterium]|nr:DUF4279 domain-containing protein [Alphaproteobacteria bacterium]